MSVGGEVGEEVYPEVVGDEEVLEDFIVVVLLHLGSVMKGVGMERLLEGGCRRVNHQGGMRSLSLLGNLNGK